MGTLDGKVALVTGGSRGIGRAIAERLGRDGATVGVGYARNTGAATEVVERIRKDGGAAFAVEGELGHHGDADALWAAFDRAAPGPELDILVNNAGIVLQGELEELSEQGLDEVFAVNVRAPFMVTARALPRLRDGGRIVNIGSAVTRIAVPGIVGYSATKGAIDVLTLNLAQKLGPRGITANVVAPGVVDTDMNADWLRADQAVWDATAASSALGRVGSTDDVAGIVAFLASDDSRWVTGQVIDATGGAGLAG